MSGLTRRFSPALTTLAVLVFAGCTAPQPPLVVTDPDPAVKIPAFKKAVREKDRGAARQLVKDLNNDDPAVRLYSIGALERMTGERLGYRYYDDEAGRADAVGRWQNWLAGRETVADSSPSEPGRRRR